MRSESWLSQVRTVSVNRTAAPADPEACARAGYNGNFISWT
jgi:hypothetical protein